MDTRERIVLYVVVLALAIAVVYLALTNNGGGCPDCGELDQRLVAIDGAIGRLETRVTDAERKVDGVAASISTHDDRMATARDEMATAHDEMAASLARLECRVAELCRTPGEREGDDSSKCGGAGGCDFTP